MMELERGPAFRRKLEQELDLEWEQRAPAKLGALTVAHSLGSSVLLVPGIARAWVTEDAGVGFHYRLLNSSFSSIWTKYERPPRPVEPAFSQLVFGDQMPNEVLLYDAEEGPALVGLTTEEKHLVIDNVFEKLVNGGIHHLLPAESRIAS